MTRRRSTRTLCLQIVGLLGAAALLLVTSAACVPPCVIDALCPDCDPIRLGQDTDGETVTLTLAVGTPLVVTLEANHTTPYSWDVAELDQTVLERTSVDYQPLDCPPGMTGCGGHEIWTFTATAAGTTTLRLEHRQWSDPTSDPAGTFEIVVTVTQ